jgi:hypothetical protein
VSIPPALRSLLLIAACLVVVAVHGLVVAQRRTQHPGDFDISREFGRRFLADEPLYAGGLHYPYMPSAAMAFAPLALVDARVAFVARYGVALACLWLSLRLLECLLVPRRPRVGTQRMSIAALTLLLGAHYIIRDLDDAGPHLILLGILVTGIYSAAQHRTTLAGLCFGLAAAIKAPAMLFLPFLLWKRRWPLLLASILATAAWVALPALWMGAGNWWVQQRQWAGIVAASVAGRPLPAAAENERRVQNQALKPALMRYLAPETQDPPHPLAPGGGPPPVALAPGIANGIASTAMLALVVFCCWRDAMHETRPQRSQGAGDAAWVVECSAVLILCIVLAPLAWVQHLVLLLPALYLIVAQQCAYGGLGTPAAASVATYAFLTLALTRELLGRDAYVFLLAAGLHTLCALLILAVVALDWPTLEAR